MTMQLPDAEVRPTDPSSYGEPAWSNVDVVEQVADASETELGATTIAIERTATTANPLALPKDDMSLSVTWQSHPGV
jgi:hypothetical protein